MPSNKSLVIVESPTKARTISKFLGRDFIVESSFGHIRDLPEKKLGVDLENNFEPEYVTPAKAKKRVTELKKAAAKADRIILATDEDREGEAIAWHLQNALKIKGDNYERIVFHEITPGAIKEALEHPRKIDLSLVDAQQARRVLDRLVGYKLSPLLWAKIRRGLSAGRVQSAALRLIVEREREIQKFVPQEYWSVEAKLSQADPASLDAPNNGDEKSFSAKLNKINDKTVDKLEIKSENEAKAITAELEGAKWEVSKIETKEVSRNPAAPFTTSTLQQEANRKLGFSGAQTMRLAQQLYEGVDLGEHGATGLITYMRTDAVNLAETALAEAREVIAGVFGKEYVLEKPRRYSNKSKNAQEAHEAIRPTSLARTPDEISGFLDAQQLKLYELIWKRTVASQMPEAKLLQTGVDIGTGTKYGFRATGQTVLFDGFLKVYFESTDDIEEAEGLLPELKEQEVLRLLELSPYQHFTEPKPRYTDASLVKALEEYGIGRPSTYAPTIGTLIERKYVDRDQRRLVPTEIGILVSDFLGQHFPEIVDYDFTARMEEELDEIADGKLKWQPVIAEFYTPFSTKLEEKKDTIEKVSEPIDDKCPLCGSPMVARYGRFGKFGMCTRYPECKGTVPLGEDKKKQEELEALAKTEKCPICGSDLTVRHGRFGAFLGCSKYPECKGILKIEKIYGTCPECNQGQIVARRGGRGKRTFYGCNRYPDCTYTTNTKPDEEVIKPAETQTTELPASS